MVLYTLCLDSAMMFGKSISNCRYSEKSRNQERELQTCRWSNILELICVLERTRLSSVPKALTTSHRNGSLMAT